MTVPTRPPPERHQVLRNRTTRLPRRRSASGRASGQRFVPVRSVENQAALMRHRARGLMVGQRTAALSALRGHLSEIGVVAAQGVPNAYALKTACASTLASLVQQIDGLDEAIEAVDRTLEASARADETARRLMTIPGISLVTAMARLTTIQDFAAFCSGRNFAAFLGLTPGEHSTSGKPRRGGSPSWATASSGRVPGSCPPQRA